MSSSPRDSFDHGLEGGYMLAVNSALHAVTTAPEDVREEVAVQLAAGAVVLFDDVPPEPTLFTALRAAFRAGPATMNGSVA